MIHNFNLINGDTDSIMFAKQNGEEFTPEEQTRLLEEINAQLPDLIKFEHDGYYQRVIIIKTKNYILWDGKKLKIKGSALRASTKCQALKELIKEMIDILLKDDWTTDQIQQCYIKYIKEALNVQEIKRWSCRKTISERTMKSERLNETKVMDALGGVEWSEGDRVWLYYKEDDTLGLVEQFDGQYNKIRLVKQIYDTMKTFWTILDKSLFLNYTLKKNKDLLEHL